MPAELSSPTTGFSDQGNELFGSRMEAATEALLRARDHVISTLDRQVAELQQLHRALASAPVPLILAEEPEPAPAAPMPTMSRPNVFEQAPMFQSCPMPPPSPPSGFLAQPVSAAFAPVVAETVVELRQSAFDPALERATLDELNDALANAFASISIRSRG